LRWYRDIGITVVQDNEGIMQGTIAEGYTEASSEPVCVNGQRAAIGGSVCAGTSTVLSSGDGVPDDR